MFYLATFLEKFLFRFIYFIIPIILQSRIPTGVLNQSIINEIEVLIPNRLTGIGSDSDGTIFESEGSCSFPTNTST